eukprot:TRINITY_DN7868_c0_g1_i1.p2 TRINITY_DN7868_c0_g1~~TRINITY_DN7868_c0_g1_i1.p2  ORF type:complete len:223 (-),score=59.99 TRINITY_DN7868_c0_g1_i1:835-1503(-)
MAVGKVVAIGCGIAFAVMVVCSAFFLTGGALMIWAGVKFYGPEDDFKGGYCIITAKALDTYQDKCPDFDEHPSWDCHRTTFRVDIYPNTTYYKPVMTGMSAVDNSKNGKDLMYEDTLPKEEYAEYTVGQKLKCKYIYPDIWTYEHVRAEGHVHYSRVAYFHWEQDEIHWDRRPSYVALVVIGTITIFSTLVSIFIGFIVLIVLVIMSCCFGGGEEGAVIHNA